MYAWIFHGDAVWPHFADKESPFCDILLHSTDIFLPSIFFSGVEQRGGGWLSISPTVFTGCFCVRSFYLKKQQVSKASPNNFSSFSTYSLFISCFWHLPFLKDSLFPVFTLLFPKQQWKWETSHTHKLCPLVCPTLSPPILFSHLTQSLSCTSGKLLQPAEELWSLALSFRPHVYIRI